MKNIKLILLFALIFSVGCEKDFLDTKPYDTISSANAWTSDENATMAVNGIYNAINQEYTLHGFPYHFSNFGPDGFNWFRDEEIQRGIATSSHHQFERTYTAFYRVINYANDAIANLADNPNVNADLAERLTGEAKYMRGVSYFYLLELYGGVVILDKPVPSSETYLPRSSAEEVRQLVINDFTSAIELLPVSYDDSEFGRATKGAAIAMLGKTYLYNEQWSQATEQFERIMGNEFDYGLVEDYAGLFDQYEENNQEIVFSVQEIMQIGLGSRYDNWIGARIFNNGQSRSQPSYNLVSSYTHEDGTPIDMSLMPERDNFQDEYEYGLELIDWYQNTFADADERVHATVILPGFTAIGSNGVEYMVKWPYADHVNDPIPALRYTFNTTALYHWRKHIHEGSENPLGRNHGPNDVPIIRFADVLLMYAEATNEENGPTAEVYDAVNKIRLRVGLPELAGLSQEEMRRAIREERLKELGGEGHLFFDVRRWRLAHTNDPLFGLNHELLDYRGMQLGYERVFTEKDYLWPIPQLELDLNPNLEQNPGW